MSVYDVNGNVIDSGGTSNWNIDKWNGKVLVTEGNSLVASTNWGAFTASFLGMTHYNVGGSGSAIIVNPTTAGSTQADITADVADNFPPSADVILMQGDTNTNMNGNASDQMDGADPQTTWTAKMNWKIRCLKAKYHNCIIVLMPDSVRYDGGVQQYTLEKNRTSYEMMKAVAEYNRLIFWDVDGSTPFNPLYNDNFYSRKDQVGDIQDYVHPANYWQNDSSGSIDKARYAMAKGRAIAQFLSTLIFDPVAPNTATENWQNDIK